jgi:hypothetical protein
MTSDSLRTLGGVVLGIVCSLSAILSSQPREIGGIGLTVFTEPDFRGTNATFREDVPNMGAFGMTDRISSLRVGPGEMWEACDRPNYGGRCQVFSGSERDLRRSGWSNIISSARRVRGGGGNDSGRLELFSRSGYSGDRRTIERAVPNLAALTFNDEAMSLRLGTGDTWQVCAEPNYQDCVVVNSDWNNLNGLNMSRRISSVRPWQGQRPPPAPEARLVLFDGVNYRGRAQNLTGAAPILNFEKKAHSAQIISGRWEICEDGAYRGRCMTIDSSVPNLARLGFPRGVNSARPR